MNIWNQYSIGFMAAFFLAPSVFDAWQVQQETRLTAAGGDTNAVFCQGTRALVVTDDEGVFTHQETLEIFAVPDSAGGATSPPASRAKIWAVDDETAQGRGVAIDDVTVWGGWTGAGGRVTAYSLSGGGEPSFEFSSFDTDGGGVVSAKGADRILFVEGNTDEQELWLHAFTSESNGVPDWSFELPSAFNPGFIRSVMLAVSYDGSTVAAVIEDLGTIESTLYIFDAETGDIVLDWTDSTRMSAVDLTDDGAIALVSQANLATVVDTDTGDILFQVGGSGSGDIHYRISGDGSVLVVGGFRLEVYQHDGDTYQQVLEFNPAYGSWFGMSSVVSRDGSTVGALTRTDHIDQLEVEVLLFDVESGEMLGSHFFSGSGSFQGNPFDAASSDDGSVMAFASWGTENQDWPEIMVFNREVELIGQIEFPGSAWSVDVSADGQYVVGGAKSIHANEFGSGGRVELIEITAGGNPIPILIGLEPDTTMVGSQEIMLTVHGTGFREVSVVRFGGADRPTSFVDTETLTAEIPAADLESAGVFSVTVFNPAPGGGESQPLDFEVELGPAPLIDVDPTSVTIELEAGQLVTENLAIANLGASLLEWEVTDESAGGGDSVVLTHSASMDIHSLNTAVCSSDKGVTTTENRFLRTFTLSEFGVPGDFNVAEITFGVQTLTDSASITVNLYTLEGEFIYENMALIGTATETLVPQEFELVTVAVAGTAPAGSILVVEIEAPDLSGIARFVAGSNNLGEIAPSYFASAACELFEPIPYAAIDFPDVHLVMAVTGAIGPVDCTLPDWVGTTPSSGSISEGESQAMDVTLSAMGLAPGVYEASLCLASNDPMRPLTVVPLELVVNDTEPPPDVIFDDRFEPIP